ncbi:DNA polymerase III subunit tau [Roseivivax sp. THAF40]|uniref:DNA polymerase III subunit delta' n=1 Tax=unclassified Roseivivax TaxID=2639302 RepID=UPI00126963E0|nr:MULTISPECIES: DNA polymerase III subunit delta' [unclassified Roseivivax]QFS83613.1 DNA polymerase III subunit tau [Roseivivax sp. THAF197b]QFT47421.1 DNA polymerase III subunit tau [Roseivivax sp. THAF40]
MKEQTLPDPTQVDGAPHPRETERLIGQAPAEAAFLDAFNTGRLHHAWMLVGPKGVGKATLAWRIARFLLATPDPDPEGDAGLFGAPPLPETLDIGADHPVMRRSRAGSEPGLFALTRGPNDKGDRLAAEIRVDQVRKLKSFFSLSATDGGRRVVIVDAADEMNVNAANALLKLLEEPPARTVLLLVVHQPARLLPTIRSRCRELRLTPLGPEDMAAALDQAGAALSPQEAAALAELSAGSVGAAMRIVGLDGLALYRALLEVMGTLPDLDTPRALKLADGLAQRGQEERRDLFFTLVDLAFARLARTGVTGAPPARPAAPEEAALFSRLAPHAAAGRAWADVAQMAGDRSRHGRAVNVDPASLVFDTVMKMRETASALRR